VRSGATRGGSRIGGEPPREVGLRVPDRREKAVDALDERTHRLDRTSVSPASVCSGQTDVRSGFCGCTQVGTSPSADRLRVARAAQV